MIRLVLFDKGSANGSEEAEHYLKAKGEGQKVESIYE